MSSISAVRARVETVPHRGQTAIDPVILVAAAVVTGALTAASKGSAPEASVVAGYLVIVAAVALVVLASRTRVGRFDAPRATAEA